MRQESGSVHTGLIIVVKTRAIGILALRTCMLVLTPIVFIFPKAVK